MQILKLGDTEVAYSLQPGKPLMLLVRMAQPGSHVWDRIWPRLAEAFSLAAVGLPLPKDSVLDRPKAMFGSFAKACVEVAEALNAKQFHILGWVGGSHIALRCAVEYPERVLSCTAVGPFHSGQDMRVTEKFLAFRRVMFEQPDRELYAFYWFMSTMSAEFVDDHFEEVERLAIARASHDPFLKLDAETMMKWDRAIQREWLTTAEFGRIEAPTLLVAFGRNRWNAGPTAEMAKAVARKIPNARLVTLSRLNAMVLWEDPNAFLKVAEPFFRQVTGRVA